MLSGNFSNVWEHYSATINNSLFLPIILHSTTSQKDSLTLSKRYLEHTPLSKEERKIVSSLEQEHPEREIDPLLTLIQLWQTAPPDGLENFVHLARAAGVPTRYVWGSVDSIWAECYIKGYGWLPVEIGDNILAKDSFRRTSCPKNFKNSDIIALSASAREDIFHGWAVKRTDSIPDFDFALAGVVPPDSVKIFEWEFRLEKEDSLLNIIAKPQNGEKKNFIFRENSGNFNMQNINISIQEIESFKPILLKITRKKID
ncbi:transglutaminase domain-containing protein [bacterium]|nr:transglutaminase domain-containing protein [bacterium]